MAAYEAVVSVMNTLNIQNHPRVSTFLDQKQIQPLHKIIDFMLDFIESSNAHGGRKEEVVLESQIASAAHAAEDVIESHIVDQILAGSTGNHGETSSGHVVNLEAVINDMMVGFDDELIQIMDRLTGHQPGLQIVPIVGMGGIGKTTLAKIVYENSLIVEHFDIRAWVTISQEYSVKKIISELGLCLGAFDCEINQENEDQLGLKAYQSLWGRRYLIVLDDIWSIEVWDKIKVFFPDNDCRSRVVITSRISNVATHLSSSPFVKNFLDEDTSWRLFCGEVFLGESCPPEVEEIGKKIVSECKGLPLSIILIGGLLRNSIRTREYWENFKRDLNSNLMSGNDEHCLNILSLSYNHLPAHLKPCFLYMGVFPENERIRVSDLIKRFVAEGFLRTLRLKLSSLINTRKSASWKRWKQIGSHARISPLEAYSYE